MMTMIESYHYHKNKAVRAAALGRQYLAKYHMDRALSYLNLHMSSSS